MNKSNNVILFFFEKALSLASVFYFFNGILSFIHKENCTNPLPDIISSIIFGIILSLLIIIKKKRCESF